MGQKVHPLGFRVGITKKHQSQWFARFNKHNYSTSVLEDRMIRDTLSKLFPELLNTAANPVGGKKRDEEFGVTPRITQIKIERGLIPYEIGIQIHAENCKLLKSAINNLKVNRDLIVKLQKTRRYLLNLKLKLKDLTNNNVQTELNNLQETSTQNLSSMPFPPEGEKAGGVSKTKVKVSKTKGGSSNGKKTVSGPLSPGGGKGRGGNPRFKFRKKLTRQELRRQRLIKKRLNKRQSIRRRYRQLILKGLFIKKTGTKITQTLSLNVAKKFRKGLNALKQSKTRLNLKSKPSMKGALLKSSFTNTFSSRIKKKFVTLFIQKMNRKFLAHLKELSLSVPGTFICSPPVHPLGANPVGGPTTVEGFGKKADESASGSFSNSNVLPLGYSKKWSFNHRVAALKTQPIYKLNRLVVVLEQKLLVKVESLKKEFIAFGSISPRSAESLGFFQTLNFLQNLKELINKLKREQKLSALSTESKQSISKNSSTSQTTQQTNYSKLKVRQSTTLSLAETVLQNKLNNIEGECRKIKFIEYLKDIVKKHRTENIYYYLSTMSDARKELKKIKQFTKQHASFLFGLNLENSNSSGNLSLQDKINERVSKVLEKTAKKADFEKTLQDFLLDQIEKQRNKCLQNLQLTPKISIKFYSVNKKTLEQKASIVSEAVVDALEKRKAFRKVIKDAKETLMRNPGVKGVKIRVAGRLNGAEIARNESVRSGRVPLQTLRANLDYSYRTANTIYGIIGVKVWIFKGYVK